MTRRKTAVGIHNMGDDHTGPYWVALVGRGDIGAPPMPTASDMIGEVWRRFGGDTPVLIYPSGAR